MLTNFESLDETPVEGSGERFEGGEIHGPPVLGGLCRQRAHEAAASCPTTSADLAPVVTHSAVQARAGQSTAKMRAKRLCPCGAVSVVQALAGPTGHRDLRVDGQVQMAIGGHRVALPGWLTRMGTGSSMTWPSVDEIPRYRSRGLDRIATFVPASVMERAQAQQVGQCGGARPRTSGARGGRGRSGSGRRWGTDNPGPWPPWPDACRRGDGLWSEEAAVAQRWDPGRAQPRTRLPSGDSPLGGGIAAGQEPMCTLLLTTCLVLATSRSCEPSIGQAVRRTIRLTVLVVPRLVACSNLIPPVRCVLM